MVKQEDASIKFGESHELSMRQHFRDLAATNSGPHRKKYVHMERLKSHSPTVRDMLSSGKLSEAKLALLWARWVGDPDAAGADENQFVAMWRGLELLFDHEKSFVLGNSTSKALGAWFEETSGSDGVCLEQLTQINEIDLMIANGEISMTELRAL